MRPQEENQQKFEVKIDDNGDFKIVSGNNEAPTKKRKQQNKMMSTEPKRSVATHAVRGRKRAKSFIPSGLSKKEIQKIRRNVAIQHIAEYVRIVSPDDGIVNEEAFFAWIKWSLFKKHPEKYLDAIKKKGIMVPIGNGMLRFTKEF